MGLLDKISEFSPSLASELENMGKEFRQMADESGLTELGEELKAIGKEYQNEKQEWKDDPQKKMAELGKESRKVTGKKRLKLVADGMEITPYNDWKVYDDDDKLIYYASRTSYDYMIDGFTIKDLNHKMIAHEDIRGVLQNKHYLEMHGEDVSLIQKRGLGYSVQDGEWTVSGSTISHHGKTVGTIIKKPSLKNTTTYVTYNNNEDPLWILIMTMLKK